MPIEIQPINSDRSDFVGRVSGIDIASGVSTEAAVTIENAMDHYAVLVFPDQVIDDEQQFQFSTQFGPMETATGDLNASNDRRLSMNVNDISNLDENGKVLPRDNRSRLFGLANMLWHSDSSFKPTPAKFSLLSGRSIPEEGGNTEFADMRAAWDALDPDLQQQCLPLVCEHSQIYSRGQLGFFDFTEEERNKWQPVVQRLVRRHPRTDRLSLYLSSRIGTIQDWPVPEARMFMLDLLEHATQRHFVYAHQWQQWDLVMWDNRVLTHRARRYDYKKPRDMHRTTVSDCTPTLEQPL